MLCSIFFYLTNYLRLIILLSGHFHLNFNKLQSTFLRSLRKINATSRKTQKPSFELREKRSEIINRHYKLMRKNVFCLRMFSFDQKCIFSWRIRVAYRPTSTNVFLNTLRSSLLNFEFLALFLLIPTWHFFLILQSILISFLQVHLYPSNL